MKFNISLSKEDELVYIDICNILNGKETYVLPDYFKGISSKVKLLTELKLCTMENWFALVHCSSKSAKQLESSNYLSYITLQCQYGRKYKKTEKIGKYVLKTK